MKAKSKAAKRGSPLFVAISTMTNPWDVVGPFGSKADGEDWLMRERAKKRHYYSVVQVQAPGVAGIGVAGGEAASKG